MEMTELINHPERLDRDTLYELRSTLALYPYFQTARLLMLQNLFLLHDPTFDEELRRAALYITDRKVIFQMVEAAHYQLRTHAKPAAGARQAAGSESRTVALIDTFLESIPKDDEENNGKKKRQPTPADAAIDYVAYLLETEAAEQQANAPSADTTEEQADSGSRTVDLIDTFLEQEQGRIQLAELPTDSIPEEEETVEEKPEESDEEYFTETLARIYIKQGRYQKALDIITRLSERIPSKNVYFADQIRFLEKLIINNNKTKLK